MVARYCVIEKHRANLRNVDFRRADRTELSYPDASFDAVVSVFSIFFVTDMVAEVRELWRVLRPRGKLAITTWGPRMFEPGSQAFWLAVKETRPDLVASVSPWERVTRPDALRQLLSESGIKGAEITRPAAASVCRRLVDYRARFRLPLDGRAGGDSLILRVY